MEASLNRVGPLSAPSHGHSPYSYVNPRRVSCPNSTHWYFWIIFFNIPMNLLSSLRESCLFHQAIYDNGRGSTWIRDASTLGIVFYSVNPPIFQLIYLFSSTPCRGLHSSHRILHSWCEDLHPQLPLLIHFPHHLNSTEIAIKHPITLKPCLTHGAPSARFGPISSTRLAGRARVKVVMKMILQQWQIKPRSCRPPPRHQLGIAERWSSPPKIY